MDFKQTFTNLLIPDRSNGGNGYSMHYLPHDHLIHHHTETNLQPSPSCHLLKIIYSFTYTDRRILFTHKIHITFSILHYLLIYSPFSFSLWSSVTN